MKHLDLFSGIGGFALASSWVWEKEYENIGHSDICEYACKVYHKHFPDSKCLGDITKIDYTGIHADLITGGFPCQPHSTAGLRKGADDERDLWGECVRALCGVRPKYALFENVSGLFSSDDGRFFNRVLSDLAKTGYDVIWQVISAASIGACHTRKRVWILAYLPGSNVMGVSPEEARGALESSQKSGGCFSRQWLEVATEFCRVDDGIPNRVDRLAGIGNAIVPQVAYQILKKLPSL